MSAVCDLISVSYIPGSNVGYLHIVLNVGDPPPIGDLPAVGDLFATTKLLQLSLPRLLNGIVSLAGEFLVLLHSASYY